MAKRLTDGELSELESRVMRLECSMGYIEKKERCISYKGRDDQELVDKLEKENAELKNSYSCLKETFAIFNGANAKLRIEYDELKERSINLDDWVKRSQYDARQKENGILNLRNYNLTLQIQAIRDLIK